MDSTEFEETIKIGEKVYIIGNLYSHLSDEKYIVISITNGECKIKKCKDQAKYPKTFIVEIKYLAKVNSQYE